MYGYNGLVRQLQNGFRGRSTETPKVDIARPDADPDLSADVVLVPYDFRLGVLAAAEQLKSEIDSRLESLTSDARQRRVIVVAHSMGGLVARYWLGSLGGAPDCHALITVGTPHRGAPKALDWLVNGARIGPKRLDTASAVLAEWPSVYDLLPRYPAVWHSGTASPLYPHELDGTAFSSAGQHKGFAAKARRAYELHRDIERAWDALAGGLPEVVPLFSRGHRTMSRAVLSEAGLRVSKEGAEWLPNPDWGGDGTVPALSATPIELSDRQGVWHPVTERHNPMAGCGSIVKILAEYAAESTKAARGDIPDKPWLGLDLPEFALAGEPIEVEAELLGAEASEQTGASITVSTMDDLTAEPVRVGLARAGQGRWTGQVPGLAPGLYKCTVGAVGVPDVDQVRCVDVVAVVAP
jgi:pimeloyl-ACP methyl ester carboxylesterase